jgi:uncharacterized protein YaiI (UPF0178 family)
MKIWIDADACPRVIKDILFRASERTRTEVKVVANSSLWVPCSPLVEFVLVGKGLDVADTHIATECAAGDIVVTADIPLAALIVPKGAHALNPRGELYTPENIAERLSVRNFLQGMRDAGETTGGPPAFHDRDKQKFANALDALLRKAGRG